MDDQLPVQIKGINDGLLITLDEGDWLEAKTVLLTTINQQVDFLRGGNLIIDVGDRILSDLEVSILKDDLEEANSFKSKMKDYLIGGLIGAVIGIILSI